MSLLDLVENDAGREWLEREDVPRLALLEIRQAPRWPALVVSAVLHVALAAYMPAFETWLPRPVHPLRELARSGRLRGPVYLRFTRQQIEHVRKAELRPARRRPLPARPAVVQRAAVVQHARPPQAVLEEPGGILLQPLPQPALLEPVNLPSFMVRAAPRPSSATRRFQPPARTVHVQAVLDVPAVVAEAGSVSVAALPRAGGRGPELPTLAPPGPAVPGEDESPGSSAAVISISDRAPQHDEVYRVPPGIQTGNGKGTVLVATPAVAARSAAERPVAAPGGTANGNAASPKDWTFQALGGMVQVQDAADGSRTLSYPNNGDFDIVVLNARLPGEVEIPEGVLTGKPVYTVYLSVGPGKEWILQYALPPASEGSAQHGMVVSLEAEPEVKAPFIRSARLPSRLALEPKRAVLFGGKITADGHVEGLRAVGVKTELHIVLMQYLARWRFRPATKNRVATAVEMVLIVPIRAQKW